MPVRDPNCLKKLAAGNSSRQRVKDYKSKEERNDQEMILLSSAPNPGHHMGKRKKKRMKTSQTTEPIDKLLSKQLATWLQGTDKTANRKTSMKHN